IHAQVRQRRSSCAGTVGLIVAPAVDEQGPAGAEPKRWWRGAGERPRLRDSPGAAPLGGRGEVVVLPSVRALVLHQSVCCGGSRYGSCYGSDSGGCTVATGMRSLREGRSRDGGGEGKDGENLQRTDH